MCSEQFTQIQDKHLHVRMQFTLLVSPKSTNSEAPLLPIAALILDRFFLKKKVLIYQTLVNHDSIINKMKHITKL
jgi:hypothetical protein